ncbi:MAG: glycoside hydrolase family 1 protein [Collinsella sp.]|nr:glycoside hydrolase family 1 protein [Collinsella sp.]
MTTTLPDDFFFGAALSGPQTEGGWRKAGKIESVWDRWSQEDIDAFHNKVGSYVGNDMGNRYREDYRLFCELGLTSARTSIQWTRLIDATGALNPAGAELYHEMLAAAREEGIDLFMNLYHFDMPAYLLDRGGWEKRETVEAFADYARQAFREFGQEVRCWFTFNEPICEPENSYTEGRWIPFVHDFQRAMTVQYHIALAHALAVREFRLAKEEGVLREDAKIGLINCFAPPYTKEGASPEDLEAVRMTDGLHNRWWLDLAADGRLPADVIDTLAERGVTVPARPGDGELIAFGKVDWLGFNYYQPVRVQAPAANADEHGTPVFAAPYLWPERRMNESRGWEIYPEGIYDFGMKIKNEHPDLEFFISENGMGVEGEDAFRDADGVIQDDYRIDFVRDHLRWVAKAIEDGANCVGYHYWAVIDNWSWTNAFKNRYGFIGVDLAHGYERYRKKSADWLCAVATTHVVE